jgi:hypothetical protein
VLQSSAVELQRNLFLERKRVPRTVEGIGSPTLVTLKQTSSAVIRDADTFTRSHHRRRSVTRGPLRVFATAQTRPRPSSKRAPPRARALTRQRWTSRVQRPLHRLRARAAVAGWLTATLIETRSPRVQPIGPVTRTSLPSFLWVASLSIVLAEM